MKTETKIKDFDAVKMMRDIRDKISLEIQNMSFAEIKEYFKKRREQFEASQGDKK